MVTIICPRCQAQLGVPPNARAVTCPHCGNVSAAVLAPLATVVGPPMVPVVPLVPRCSRAAYVLLGIFFGSLGIHNFAAGRSGRGLAQLLITVFTFWLILPIFVVGVWVLVDVCTIATDGNGLRMS